MNKKYKTNEKSWKSSFLHIFIVVILFLVTGYLILEIIKISLLNNMKENSIQNAKIHISELSNIEYASDIINDLLEDRIVSTCNIILKYEGNLSNKLLEEISLIQKVDHIYWYNFEGKIEFTANDYLGWEARETDAVYEFIKSKENVLVEPVRKAADSGVYTKYGQIKGETGFVQVGILADKIEELTDQFCPQRFINELLEKEDIIYVFYLNNDNKVLHCNTDLNVYDFDLGIEEKTSIANDEIYYTQKEYEDKDVFEAIYPIYINDKKEGSLILVYSLENLKSLRDKISINVVILLICIFILYCTVNIKSKKKNKIIQELAYYDSITNLFNKNYLKKVLGDELEKYPNIKKSIFLIKCKNFEMLKASYGEANVNKLLMAKLKQLEDLPIKNSTIFRYYEDCLCIYVKEYKDRQHLIDLSKFILDSMDKITGEVENEELLSGNIGIFEIDVKFEGVEDIIKYIDTLIGKLDSMNDSKYIFFDEYNKEKIILDGKIEKELLDAYYRNYDEFYLLYQPQLDLRTNKIMGVEALARWDSSKLGPIPPNKFIDIAERSNTINALGKWINKTACKFLKELDKKGIKDIKVAVNISVFQLLQDNFVDEIWSIIEETKINPKQLKLEITETSLIDNYKLTNDKLKLLRAKGISISLDDFGTGHSSLSRLKNLNIDYLKIDKSFIDHIKNMEEDVLINSILSIAKELDLKVIAEGVEEEIQKEYLKNKGCNALQGYLFSEPISQVELIKLIETIN